MRIALTLLPVTVRQSWRRLLLTAAAIGLGVGMLLAFSAVFHAFQVAPQRTSWQTAIASQMTSADISAMESNGSVSGVPSTGVLFSQGTVSNLPMWRDQPIQVYSVRAIGADPAQLPGVKLPAQGEYYLSPALAAADRANPQDGLASRFGQRSLGVLPPTLVGSPDSLTVLRGMSTAEAEHAGANLVTSWQSAYPKSGYEKMITNVLYLGIFILLFPVVMLVSIATQLGSVQREQRYAALRLVGASRTHILTIIAVESLVAAVPGVGLGILGYVAAQPFLRSFELTGRRFWPVDVQVPMWQWVLIVLGTCLLTLLANWWGLRHVHVSPLGVVRRQGVSGSPHWMRLVPLVLGFAVVGLTRAQIAVNEATAVSILQVLGGVVLISIGLILSGPWLTHRLAALMAARTGNPVALLGARYLAVHSRPVFRSVSGVVLALFAGSFYLTAVSDIPALQARVDASPMKTLRPGTVLIEGFSGKLTSAQAQQVAALPYLRSGLVTQQLFGAWTAMPCDVAARTTTHQCPAGAKLAAIGFHLGDPNLPTVLTGQDSADLKRQILAYPQVAIPDGDAPVQVLAQVAPGDLDRLRSDVIRVTGPLLMNDLMVETVDSGKDVTLTPLIRTFASLAYAGMIVTLLVAITSLTVSTAGALMERRRTLIMLRLSGMSLARLRRMVLVESAVPLAATSLVAAASGVFVGYLFMQMVSSTLDARLSPSYFAVTVGGVALAIAAIWLVMPMLSRVSDPAQHRAE